MAIELKPEMQERMMASIKRYFEEQLDQPIGDLKARLMLDFVLKELAPSIYNLAVDDAQVRIGEMVSEIDAICFETEFRYWRPS